MKKNCKTMKFNRLVTGDLDALGKLHRETKPTRDKIFEYWKNSPLNESFINKSYYNDYCMACGEYTDSGEFGKLERAHIYASCHGGSNNESNLHVLCRECHLKSEEKIGWTYWLWLGLKSQIFENGNLNSYEYDYPNAETCKADGGKMSEELLVPYEYGSEDKIKEYAKDIVLLNQIEGYEFPDNLSCFIIHNPKLFNLKCEFKNLEEILKIDESLQISSMTIEKVTKEFKTKTKNMWSVKT
tara:strand:+ start:1329 stop:2054 length:726 start_codon:yes stop_codon:yes gene_type:complete